MHSILHHHSSNRCPNETHIAVARHRVGCAAAVALPMPMPPPVPPLPSPPPLAAARPPPARRRRCRRALAAAAAALLLPMLLLPASLARVLTQHIWVGCSPLLVFKLAYRPSGD